MENNTYSVFKAVADPSRRKIIHKLLTNGTGLPINKIVDDFQMTRQAVTKHLKILESAKLVEITKVGREKFCMANPGPIKELNEWTEQFKAFWS